MADWTNSFTFPSTDEFVRTKSEIKGLEGEIAEIMPRVSALRRTLEEKRASIAPIRKCSFDILSMIFELVARVDWKSPLIIGAVCRVWRGTVMRTPRAWSLVDGRDVSKMTFSLYLRRSAHSGIHIRDDNFTPDWIHVKRAAQKVECLAMDDVEEIESLIALPNLKRLKAMGEDPWDVSCITSARFPNLRHLETNAPFYHVEYIHDLPPLETLSVVLEGSRKWLKIIQACSESPKSLKITTTDDFDYEEEDDNIYLGCLRYLEVVMEAQEFSSPVHLDKPNLETYIQTCKGRSHVQVLHGDIDSVFNMRIQCLPPPEIMQNLQILQLDIAIGDIQELLEKAIGDNSFLPNLHILEFRRSFLSDEQVEVIEAEISSWDSSDLPSLNRPPTISDDWRTKLPGEDEFKVRLHYVH